MVRAKVIRAFRVLHVVKLVSHFPVLAPEENLAQRVAVCSENPAGVNGSG